VGVASHFLLDLIPHTDYSPKGWGMATLATDLTGGALLTCALTGGEVKALAGAAGGIAPDVLQFIERAHGKRLTTPMHGVCHIIKPPLWLGIATQVLVSAGAILVLSRNGTGSSEHRGAGSPTPRFPRR